MNLALVSGMSTPYISDTMYFRQQCVISSICVSLYADAGGNSILISDSCVVCRVFRDFPFPLITPFHCDALQNQHSRLRHRGERAPSAGFFRYSTYGPSCPLQIMCH